MLVTSRVALVEVVRAAVVARPAAATRIAAERLVRSCALVDVTDAIVHAAAGYAGATVRSLDAIHMASAVRAAPDVALVYDRRLRDQLGALGIATAAPGARA